MFEAIVFLAGAVLFFLAVLYFVILWQDRVALARRHKQLQEDLAAMKEQRIDLEIREQELRVWAEGLDHQQRAIAKAEQELRMLTASKSPPSEPAGLTATGSAAGDRTPAADDRPRAGGARRPTAKNAKRTSTGKLPS